MRDIKIFACNTAEKFTEEVCNCLNLKMGEKDLHTPWLLWLCMRFLKQEYLMLITTSYWLCRFAHSLQKMRQLRMLK